MLKRSVGISFFTKSILHIFSYTQLPIQNYTYWHIPFTITSDSCNQSLR